MVLRRFGGNEKELGVTFARQRRSASREARNVDIFGIGICERERSRSGSEQRLRFYMKPGMIGLGSVRRKKVGDRIAAALRRLC